MATIRLLPDKDEGNPWPWVERQIIKLPFAGTVGGDGGLTEDGVVVKVPCLDMYGEKCPIIAATKPWWNDKKKEAMARLYWKKKSNIAQGFVVASPFEEDATPTNSIRRFVIGPELLEKLKAGMADPDMEFWPTDYLNGYDFRIRKTMKGEYNNYSTSDWVRRSRPLSEAQTLAIEQYGLFNLADFRPAKPTADGVAAIKAMFLASVAGDPYDYESWGSHYRPYGVSVETTNHHSDDDDEMVPLVQETKSVVRTTNGSDHEGDVIPPAQTKSDKASPQDLMAQLRVRADNRSQA